jgi:translation initiation factor IF-1
MHFSAPLTGHRPRSALKSYERPALAKEELLTLEGQIDEVLPDGRFGVMLDNQHRIVAYTAGKMRKFRIRSVVGDRVHVEMTPYDLSKGRIVFRERTPGAGPGGVPRRAGFRR